MTEDTRSATEIAAAAAADAGIVPIDNPTRGNPDPDAKRAPERGVYEDRAGVRRVVAAGDPIPEGWTAADSNAVEDRADGTISARDGDTGSGGRKRSGRKAAASSGSDG